MSPILLLRLVNAAAVTKSIWEIADIKSGRSAGFHDVSFPVESIPNSVVKLLLAVATVRVFRLVFELPFTPLLTCTFWHKAMPDVIAVQSRIVYRTPFS